MLTGVKEILEQVAVLYTKYGIKSNTMDDVAKKLGISKKTLYQSFRDKDDLVYKVIDYLYYKRQSEIHKILIKGLDVIDELYEIQRQIISMLKGYSNVMMNDLKKYYTEKHNIITQKYIRLLEEIIINNIQKGKDSGIYRANINCSIIAKSHVMKIMCLPENYFINLDEYTSKDFSNELFEYHLRGLLKEDCTNISNKFINKINDNKYVAHEGSQIN